jgi:tetratricopeptide (TPR) repeat protein
MRYLGGLVAMAGDPDRGRQLVERARDMLDELGQQGASRYCDFVRGDIEQMAGDIAAAREARAALCEYCERSEDHGGLSTAAADLAATLYEQASYDEAERWAGISERHAATDDVGAQFASRAVSAKVLAQRGDFGEAEALARQAVALAEPTDALNKRAAVLLSLAEVLRLTGQPQEASHPIDQAIRLYELKGNVLGAARARTLLTDPALA